VLHDDLVKAGLLPATDVTILNYTRNVEALFANKLSQELLATARDIMKEDLFVTVPITEENIRPLHLSEHENKEIKRTDEKEEEEELAVPPAFPLPDQLFQFPACSVSASTLRLMEQAVAGLEQAAASPHPFCSVRLFNTVRNVFELWCAVVPTFHKASGGHCYV
jgi:centromere/kinetochore protein ZW10